MPELVQGGRLKICWWKRRKGSNPFDVKFVRFDLQRDKTALSRAKFT